MWSQTGHENMAIPTGLLYYQGRVIFHDLSKLSEVQLSVNR